MSKRFWTGIGRRSTYCFRTVPGESATKSAWSKVTISNSAFTVIGDGQGYSFGSSAGSEVANIVSSTTVEVTNSPSCECGKTNTR
jgi:hypothetical protein